MNIDFPSSRAKFRESFGYDFPYDSDEELEAIDRKYQDESGRFPSIQSSGNGSSGACSTGIYVLQEELRVPLSEENLADLEGSVKARGRRISDAPSYKSEETRSSEGTRGREGDLMDKFLGTLDSSGKTGTSLGTGTSSTADPLGKSNADSTFFLGALDQSSANVSNYRESIKVPLRDSTSGDGYAYAPRFSNYTAAEKSTAESTFFFGCIDDEMASRMSRERIIIPTKLLPQGLDIGQEMQDDKSVRSALTCDKSYVLDGLFSEGDDEDESKHGDKRGGQRGPMRPEESDESDRHETRSRSGSSMAKSTGSSHHGSFMGWGDPYGNDSESDSDHDEEKQEDKGNVDESGREGCGNVVCDFPMNRAAFHSSFRSTNSSASMANSIVTAKSSETSGTSSSGRRASRRSSMNKNNRRRSMRSSLETINSSTSFNKSLRGSMRASLMKALNGEALFNVNPRNEALFNAKNQGETLFNAKNQGGTPCKGSHPRARCNRGKTV